MARVSVNCHQLQVLDRIIHLDAVVVGIKYVLAGRYKKIKQNMLITLSDNRVILAKQRLVMKVHQSGAFTVPWERVEMPYSFEVERPEPPSTEPAGVQYWPTVTTTPGGRWR